jgi:hypothetical protein
VDLTMTLGRDTNKGNQGIQLRLRLLILPPFQNFKKYNIIVF